MNTSMTRATAGAQTAVLATNKVLRNTYLLLSMTLLFSALTAGISMALKLPHPGLLLTLGGYFGLLFLTTKFRDSTMGLALVFALTGFMGYTLGPILSAYLAMPNGAQVVMTAMGGTGAIFLGLSGYALSSRKDFSYMGGFLMVGMLVAFMAALGAIFFEIAVDRDRREGYGHCYISCAYDSSSRLKESHGLERRWNFPHNTCQNAFLVRPVCRYWEWD